jgi:hypothetical protein
LGRRALTRLRRVELRRTRGARHDDRFGQIRTLATHAGRQVHRLAVERPAFVARTRIEHDQTDFITASSRTGRDQLQGDVELTRCCRRRRLEGAGVEIEIDPQRAAEACAGIETTGDSRIASSAAGRLIGGQAGRIDLGVLAGAGDASLILTAGRAAVAVDLPATQKIERKPQACQTVIRDGQDRVVLDPRLIIVIAQRPDSDWFAVAEHPESILEWLDQPIVIQVLRLGVQQIAALCDLDANAIEILAAGEIAGDYDEQSTGRLVVAAREREQGDGSERRRAERRLCSPPTPTRVLTDESRRGLRQHRAHAPGFVGAQPIRRSTSSV